MPRVPGVRQLFDAAKESSGQGPSRVWSTENPGTAPQPARDGDVLDTLRLTVTLSKATQSAESVASPVVTHAVTGANASSAVLTGDTFAGATAGA